MEPGTRIGDYEVMDELGRGGMGRVYRVRNVISDRHEAMKVLLPSLSGHEELAARFLREIKVLAALDHPNIAALRTALTAGDQIVMIMELVEGEPLSKRLRRGPIAVPDAIACMDQVLAALAYAHDRQVIHRDIKPANIMLGPDGVVKLTDFGIARSVNDQALTATGTTTGSLPYMPPEQINGETIDARSDIYAAGISLYEMVTGRTPFHGTSEYLLMSAHLNEKPRPAIEWCPDLPPSLNQVIMRAIEKAPSNRFQSASELRAALHGQPLPAERGLAPTEIVRRPPPVPVAHPHVPNAAPAAVHERARRRLAHPFAYMAIGGVVVVALAAGTGSYLRRAEAGLDDKGSSGASQSTGDRVLPPGPTDTVTASQEAARGTPKPGSGVEQALSAETGTNVPRDPEASPLGRDTRNTGGRRIIQPDLSASEGAGQPSPSSAGDAAQQPAPPGPQPSPEAAAPGPQEPVRLADELDSLALRASAVDESLNAMRQQQARQGLGLRGDVLTRQRSMQLNLSRAAEAAERGDLAEARRYQRSMQSDLEALERFLGR